MEFSRQEYWNGLPFPPPGDLPNPGIELASLASCFTDRQILHHCATWEALPLYQYTKIFLLYSAWTSQIYTATIILGHTCTYFSKIEIIDSWDKYIFDLSTQGQNKWLYFSHQLCMRILSILHSPHIWHFQSITFFVNLVDVQSYLILFFISVCQIIQFSRSVMSDSLWPQESQHARPPCPSSTPGVHPNSCASSWWCYPAI